MFCYTFVNDFVLYPWKMFSLHHDIEVRLYAGLQTWKGSFQMPIKKDSWKTRVLLCTNKVTVSYCGSGMLLLIPEFLTLHFRFSIWGIHHPSDFESVIFGLSGWNVYIVGFGGRCSFIQRYLKIHCYFCNGITWSVLHTGSYIQLSDVGIIIISLVADLELA